jgi:predicted secreted hydrolase
MFKNFFLLVFLVIGTILSAQAPLTLPQDEKLHRSVIEWYYYTGEVETLAKDKYGIQAVIFQVMIPGQPIYYSAQTAITNVKNNTHVFNTEFSGVDQLPTQPATGFNLTTGLTNLVGSGGLHHVSFGIPGNPSFNLFGLSIKPPTLMNGNGFEQIGNGALYYYSYPSIDTIGIIAINGSSEIVTGTLWHDHQWGVLATNANWNWYGIRLNNDTQLMIAEIRMADGTSGGNIATFICKNGKFITLDSNDVKVVSNGSWTSPTTQAVYPQGWTVRVNSLDLTATITTKVQGQEVIAPSAPVPGTPMVHYWEGLCNVAATIDSKDIKGYAYVELTGY